MRSFLEWDLNVVDEKAHQRSHDLFFGSGAGVLFPPGALHPLTGRTDLFQSLSPTCDDSWFNWMTYLAGTPIRRAPGKRFRVRAWLRTTRNSLAVENFAPVGAGVVMDESLRGLTEAFGPLPDVSIRNSW